jgi:hypothetical protein
MKPGNVKLVAASLGVLVIQLTLVSWTAGEYLYQRGSFPRVWTRTVAINPGSLMKGRYLTLELYVDGCQSTLPSAKQAAFGRNVDGTTNQLPYSIAGSAPITFPARLAVKDNKLIAIRIPSTGDPPDGQLVAAGPGMSCESLGLVDPVRFFVPKRAPVPMTLSPGMELWIEVTVPLKGPPRPVQLALKQDGRWEPLAFE